MAKIIGALRVKNEARWIARVVSAMQALCERVIVFDDHSTDLTADICREMGCEVVDSPFARTEPDESADKQYLLEHLWANGTQIGDCVLMLDGDEILRSEDMQTLQDLVAGSGNCWSFPIIYLWDREDQIRVDRWYARFHRPSMFRLTGKELCFRPTGNGGNFHGGSVPLQIISAYQLVTSVAILHLGYLYREDRIRKYYWYNSKPPIPAYEDGYRHMVIGDLFPVDSSFAHAGPLELRPLGELTSWMKHA